MSEMRGTVTGSDLARLRQGCYRVLAAGFGRPSPEVAEQVDAGFSVLEEMGVSAFSFARDLWEWQEALKAADPAVLAAEYVRLFGSGIDGALCPPVESQHLGANLQGDPARHAGRIEDLMRRSGFNARTEDRPPDHLAVELELASALCGSEASDRSAGGTGLQWLQWQQELVAVLAMWVPGLADTVGAGDRSGVLAALTKATTAFVVHEHDLVRLLMVAASEESQ